MKYRSSKGTVINIPDGLTPKQIKQIKADADAGYGTRAQQTANDLGKKISAAPTTTATTGGGLQDNTGAQTASGGGLTPRQKQRLDYLLKYDPKHKQVAKLQGIANGSIANDGEGENDPKMGADGKPDPGTTGLGDTGTAIDNFLEGIFGNIQPLDLSGAPKILSEGDLAAQRQSVYDSAYRHNTQDYEQKKKLDLEAQKQELAERGIPINFSSDGKDLYSRSINSINTRYDTLDQEARDRANLLADDSLTKTIGNSKTARDAFVQAASAEYASKLDAAATGNNVLQTIMTKYGLDREAAQRELDREVAKRKNKRDYELGLKAIAKSGSGGSSGGGGEEAGGFEVPV